MQTDHMNKIWSFDFGVESNHCSASSPLGGVAEVEVVRWKESAARRRSVVNNGALGTNPPLSRALPLNHGCPSLAFQLVCGNRSCLPLPYA